MTNRCDWANSSPEMQAYHDNEWGHPEHAVPVLFELLCLETYQAGLSWQTVINKRPAFRRDFYKYDVARVAAMTDDDLERLLTDKAIIRNRLKLTATINNARVLANWSESVPFDEWLWNFVDGRPVRHAVTTMAEMPATTELAKAIAKAMKKLGLKFVGPTTVYSFLQAAGLVNDHLLSCDWAPENQAKGVSK